MSPTQPIPGPAEDPIDSALSMVGVIQQGLMAASHLKQATAGAKFHVIVVPDDADAYIHACDGPEQTAEFIRGVMSSGLVYVIQGHVWRISKVPRRLVSPDGEHIYAIDREATLEFEDNGAGRLPASGLPLLPAPTSKVAPTANRAEIL